MKSVQYLILISLFTTILGCDRFKSDHPQSVVLDENATDLTAKSILDYSNEIDQRKLNLKKETSLIYKLENSFFYAEKYTDNGKVVLMQEHSFNGGSSNNLKQYYLKNDSLVLEKTTINSDDTNQAKIKNTNTYLRSNIVFRIESRSGELNEPSTSSPFVNIPLKLSKTRDKDFVNKIDFLIKAINASDQFNMVFDSIKDYPENWYITLKSPLQNGYSAQVLVKQKDSFIDSLINDPLHFKGKKLDFKWYIDEQEAVYIPQVKVAKGGN